MLSVAEGIKPTNALEYRFVRKAKSGSSVVILNVFFTVSVFGENYYYFFCLSWD